MITPAILLVNPNRMRPPIAPVGLDYLASSLEENGYTPILCDLAFEPDWEAALDRALGAAPPLAVGVTIRNIDDAYFASQDFILQRTREIIHYIQRKTALPVVLGGIGFSCAPKEILKYTGAPLGVVGDGEESLVYVLDRLANGGDPSLAPGVISRGRNGNGRAVNRSVCDPEALPLPKRRFVDNRRYFAEGGQIGVETKRGCDQFCIYCADPVGRGDHMRLRPPEMIVRELTDLLDQGIDVIHLCDSEFNLPATHAHAICGAIRGAGLASKLRWYTYATPLGFDAVLAEAMAKAGCVGINFGVDHCDPEQLRRLGRRHTAEDIRRTAEACRQAGIVVMFDLLLGGPGETVESISRAVQFMKEVGPERVGLSCGVRIYPHTALAAFVQSQGPLESNPNLHGATKNNDDLLRPVFYVDAAVGTGIHRTVWEMTRDDRRFVIANPDAGEGKRNYNYNDNAVLEAAIRDGARGAYWDILRRLP